LCYFYIVSRYKSSQRAESAPSDAPSYRGVMTMAELSQTDYENLLVFRTSLRRFQHWSENQARQAGVTPAQHQLLVAIKGHPGSSGPTVSDLAGCLLLRHHSTVELIDRAEAAGLVSRARDDRDGRLTRICITAKGERRLHQLVPAHIGELRRLAPILDRLVAEWPPPEAPAPGRRVPPDAPVPGQRVPPKTPAPGRRVLPEVAAPGRRIPPKTPVPGQAPPEGQQP
jgi:DNA-binding MarR family transcriptional regulator